MKIIKIGFLLILLLSLVSCYPKMYEKEFFAMDTVMSIKMYGNNDFSKINKCIIEQDRLFNRNSETSDIKKINENKKTTVSDDTINLLRLSNEINKKTNGAFDIRVAPIIDLWGFYGKDYHVPQKKQIDYALKNEFGTLSIKKNSATLSNGKIDFGGIAKGYLSDSLAQIIRDSGTDSAIMSLGGNVYAIGKKPNGDMWHIGIKNPKDTTKSICSVKVCNKAVVTSGVYERGFYDNNTYYHHIIDPKTGYPAQTNLASVTVIADNGAYADAMSTALFVMGMEYTMDIKSDDFDAIFISDNNKIYITEGIKDNFQSDFSYKILKQDIN